MDGLAFIDPPKVELTVDGVALVIKPVVVRQLRALLAVVQPVLHDLAQLDPAVFDQLLQAGSADPQGGLADMGELLDFVVANAERITTALALCTGEDADWLDGLHLDRYVALLATVVRVNRDFFVGASPSLRGWIGSLAEGRPAAQPQPATTGAATPAPSPN